METHCVVVSKFTKKTQNSLAYIGAYEVLNVLYQYEKTFTVPETIASNLFSYNIWKTYREVLLNMYDILSSLSVKYYVASNDQTTYTMQIWPSNELRLNIYNEFAQALAEYDTARDVWLDYVGLDKEWYAGSIQLNFDKIDYTYIELEQIFSEVKSNPI